MGFLSVEYDIFLLYHLQSTLEGSESDDWLSWMCLNVREKDLFFNIFNLQSCVPPATETEAIDELTVSLVMKQELASPCPEIYSLLSVLLK